MRLSSRDEFNNPEVRGGTDQVLPSAIALPDVFEFSGDLCATPAVLTVNSALPRKLAESGRFDADPVLDGQIRIVRPARARTARHPQ